MGELSNVRHEKFCQRYAVTANAAQSYIDAGYTQDRDAARGCAHRLLKDPRISMRVREIRADALEKSEVDVSAELAKILRQYDAIIETPLRDIMRISHDANDPGRADVMQALADANGGQHYIDFGGLIITPEADLTEDAALSIESVTPVYDRSGVIGYQIKQYSKLQALMAKAKIFGLMPEKTDVTVSGGLLIGWDDGSDQGPQDQ